MVQKYTTMLNDNYQTVLAEENIFDYPASDMDQPQKVVDMCNALLKMDRLAEEYLYLFCYNTKMHLIGFFEINHGTVNEIQVNPRDIFMKALLLGATNIIICHNHPSGKTVASDADISITKRLVEGSNLLGIKLLDHIIIGRNCYESLLEGGVIKK